MCLLHDSFLKPGETGRPRSSRALQESGQRLLLDAGLPDVSVCIANWNCRDLLRQCLQSLLDQPQGVRLEVIVVDNASADGAADMVAEEFPEALLLRNATNHGFARANNQAARRARGRYLFFLNNDTIVPPDTLGRLADFADRYPDAGLIGPRLRGLDGKVQVSYRPRPALAAFLHRTLLLRWLGWWRGPYRRFRRQAFTAATTRPVDVLMGAAVLAPRQRFLDWGGWDEDFVFGGEDMELSYRVGRHAPLLFFPDAEILHYGSVSTRQNPWASTQIAIGFLQYFRKTGTSRLGLGLYKLAVTLDAPVQGLLKIVQALGRFLCGQQKKARKSLVAARAWGHFLLRGLVPFWKA